MTAVPIDAAGGGEPSRPTRQEQEPASDTVTELAEGLYRLQLPVFMPGLGHVNCYALEDDRGLTLVDPGLPDQATWEALGRHLAQLDARFDHVHTTVVTHSHPDHYGGVHRLQAEHGAGLLTHSSFSSTFGPDSIWDEPDSASLDLADDEDLERLRQRMRQATPWGTWREPPTVDQIRGWGGAGKNSTAGGFRVPEPSTTVEDTDEVVLGGRTWLALHTPGHTHDHLCLYDPVDGLFLSGDHVLPTITPHISGMSTLDDPLAVFFRSLERAKELPEVDLVLPAHGHPFTDLAGRADDIIGHHEDRLRVIREAGLELGDAPVEDYMRRLFKERSWGDMAASETYAHLDHLSQLGQATRSEKDGAKTYRIV